MNSNIGGNHKCDQCNNETTELFHCETCNRSREDNPSEKELLCDVCVGPHLQRGHLILDRKGYGPLVCPEHKLLQQEYCRTCDLTFCSKCTRKHSKHEFDTLEKRGSELRGQVFEMITELELGEKPLRLKKEEMSDVIESHKKEQLKRRFTQKLRSDLMSITSIKEESKMPERVEEMKSNSLKSNEFYFQEWWVDQYFKVSTGDGQLCVQRVTCRSSGLVASTDTERVTEFQGNIDRYFVFKRPFGKFFEESRLLLLVGSSAYLFVLKEELKLNQITPIRYKHVLCPYRGFTSFDSINWCYWDEETKLIKFTHDDEFTIKCDALPTVKRNDAYLISTLMFITADNNVIFANAHEKKYWIIEVGNNNKAINCTTSFDGTLVLLWCCDDESVFITTLKVDKFQPLKKYKWDTESLFTYIELDSYKLKLKLIPGVRNSSGEYDPYLFFSEFWFP
ncbi:uncharacterized protein LOC142356973 [Convolutriloba macropyga]|uniref:uncharacterized protein LOC142356973 n=1 Tax=Convolutriloba macropyga TaxID=536237 RepID=UPI003F522120